MVLQILSLSKHLKGNGTGEMKKSILVLVLAAAVCLMMTACGGQGSSGSGDPQSTADSQNSVSAEPHILTATETVEQFMQAIKDQDETSLDQVYNGDAHDLIYALNYEELNDALDDDTLISFDEKAHAFEYTIGDVKETGDTAETEVTIKTCDFGPIIKDFLQQYEVESLKAAVKGEDDEPIMDAAVEKFVQDLEKTELSKESKVTVKMTRKDGIWTVNNVKKDQAFMDALSGGSYSAFIEVNKQIKELQKDIEEDDDDEI